MNKLKSYYAELTALLIFIIYLTTMASTVIHLDVGELATVQSKLGIAHPTGYPLFTILGFLFTKLLFPFDQIDTLNLFAGLNCALAVWIFTKLVFLILNNLPETTSKKNSNNGKFELDENSKYLAAVITGLLIGLGKTFWFQSTSVEVYSLHLFLMSLILFFSVKAFFSNNNKHWYSVAVFLALGFSNHMTTILLIPGIAFLFFKQQGFKKNSFLVIAKMLLIFFPILILLYSYLPIRSAQNPVLNWGNPIDLERFLRHVSGKQYQVWIFSSLEAAKKQLIYFIQSLPQELGYIGLITSLIGILLFIKRSKTISIFLIVNFFSALLYSINYDIADIDSYFLLAFVSLSLFSTFTIVYLVEKLPSNFLSSVLVIPLIMIVVNYTDVDRSSDYVFEDYTKAILDRADQDGIVFSYLWDYFVSPSYYFRYVENYRPDVAVIDKELLRRSWYFNQLKTNMPDVVDGAKPQIDTFLKAVQPFERDEPFDASIIETHYRNLMTALVASNIEERSFYLTPEIFENEMQKGEFQLPTGYTIVPLQYFFKVIESDVGYVPAEFHSPKIRFTDNPDYYEKNIKNFLAAMMVYRIMYELQFNEINKAKYLYKKVREFNPDYRIPSNLVQQLSNK